MIKGTYPIDFFQSKTTPFYYYDMELLSSTLEVINTEIKKYDYEVHYAIKANFNPRILSTIALSGLGADCVSGGEIVAALGAGFPASKIVYAGVGKADWEIELGIDNNIAMFNVESIAELQVINEIAERKGKSANVALRINPEVDAHTHAKITTGVRGNKFGIDLNQIDDVITSLSDLSAINLKGVHFHIGSQITDMTVFEKLARKAGEIIEHFTAKGITLENVNFGGGLGINYFHPNHIGIADFEGYFKAISENFARPEGSHVHFELGRSVVAQCGTLVSRALYVKENTTQKFAIIDAGFTELIRPAMYDSYHRIENVSSDGEEITYDVVGPICESSDVFATDYVMNEVRRGDMIVIRSAGAYGEAMASQYNCRTLAKSYFSDTL